MLFAVSNRNQMNSSNHSRKQNFGSLLTTFANNFFMLFVLSYFFVELLFNRNICELESDIRVYETERVSII